jgi:hypothetical protein
MTRSRPQYFSDSPPPANALQTASLRYSRLKICVTWKGKGGIGGKPGTIVLKGLVCEFVESSGVNVAINLAFYHLNKAEIDGYLEEERAACRQLEGQKPPGS